MSQLIEVPFESGETVTVEVDDWATGPITRGGRGAEVVVQASESFEGALARVRPALQALVARLREAAERPDEISVEFGLKLSAEAGAIISRAGGEANFRVALTWRGEQGETSEAAW